MACRAGSNEAVVLCPRHGLLNDRDWVAHLIAKLWRDRCDLRLVGIGAEMTIKSGCEITFARLPDIPAVEIIAHMSDPRVAEHMPLLTFKWDRHRLAEFVSAKEACWRRDGLGHWAILCDGGYVGWGGFQKEGSEWDYGLVLKPNHFGLGARITRKAIEFAKADDRIPFVTFLLPPSRRRLQGLARLGATFVGEVEQDGAQFLKYRLDTE